jgi:hypothetical protein
MKSNPIDLYSRIQVATKAWGRLRRDKKFWGYTLEEFKAVTAPSAETRKEVAQAEAQLQEALARRDEADKLSQKALMGVVNAVKGDREEGEDGELYIAMGYVARSVRNSLQGVRRSQKAAERAAAKAASQTSQGAKAPEEVKS